LSDFELGYQNALQHVFPFIQIRGCFFHFKQAIHKWVIKNKLKKIFNNSCQFRIWVNLLCSLALVPLDKVDECFKRVEEVSNNLVDEKKKKINVTSILKYFKSTWMDGRWKKEHWNYYDYLGRRTNNDLEGFNRQLNRFLHSPHPNIYKFVDHIKGIDQKNSLRIIEYRKNPIDYGKWSLPSKQVEKETKLQRLMTAYKNDEKIVISLTFCYFNTFQFFLRKEKSYIYFIYFS